VELLPRSSFRHHYHRSGENETVIGDGGVNQTLEWGGDLPAFDPLQWCAPPRACESEGFGEWWRDDHV
jgi:hypothetical protein